MYAWAITIHKAQGATLAAAVIDVGSGIFEMGQTYTALSRLSSFDHLYLTSFDPSKIKTDPAVLAFYEELNARSKEKEKEKEI
jgi:ATP-dependent exoDNAse (exonuclease V) alpha subunit